MPTFRRKRTTINPLAELRKLLGTEVKPLSTSKLAALVNIPADSLRAVQTARRTFNPEMQRRLRKRGLDWDQKEGKWFFTYDRNAPLSLPLLESFRRLSRGDGFFQDLDLDAVIRRVIALVQRVDEQAYRSLLLDLNDALESFRETYKVDGAQEEFAQTELRFEFVKTPSGAQTLVKKFSGGNPRDVSLLLDHRRKRKSHVVLEETAEGGASSGALQPAA
jgi:hypothetical protein